MSDIRKRFFEGSRMDYMKLLAEYEAEKGLTTADMARMFGVDWQIYKNWVNRDSLPKSRIARAEEILYGKRIEELKNKLVTLSPQALDSAARAIDAIADLDRRGRS